MISVAVFFICTVNIQQLRRQNSIRLWYNNGLGLWFWSIVSPAGDCESCQQAILYVLREVPIGLWYDADGFCTERALIPK
jgi:hypothetical protein